MSREIKFELYRRMTEGTCSRSGSRLGLNSMNWRADRTERDLLTGNRYWMNFSPGQTVVPVIESTMKIFCISRMKVYFRYLVLFQIGDFKRTVRDTEHNLKICDIVGNYAENEEDKKEILQYRPYILRMNAVSRACIMR